MWKQSHDSPMGCGNSSPCLCRRKHTPTTIANTPQPLDALQQRTHSSSLLLATWKHLCKHTLTQETVHSQHADSLHNQNGKQNIDSSLSLTSDSSLSLRTNCCNWHKHRHTVSLNTARPTLGNAHQSHNHTTSNHRPHSHSHCSWTANSKSNCKVSHLFASC